MKRWFCGFSPITSSSSAVPPQPIDSEMLWKGANSFFLCGNWGKQQVITMTEGNVRLAIVGTCLASHQTLVELFQLAIRRKDYSQLIRLPGSYNLIVQDDNDTYVFTDVAGLKPIFYTEYGSYIVYSSLGVTLQQLIKAEVDSVWLANCLLGLIRANEAQNRSPFRNVKSVPSGHYLQISSGQAICKKYWQEPQEYIKFSEAADKLRQELVTAVEGRINLYGNVTSDLSGGFDSTSLALLAAKKLASQNQTLHTITFKSGEATESDDFRCAQHAASIYSNIAPSVLETQKLPPDFSNLELIPLLDTPETSLLTIGTINHTLKVIRSFGSQVHLNGEGGDAVLCASDSYLTDLFKQLKIGKFLQHAYGWSRVSRVSPIPLIVRAIKMSRVSYASSLCQQTQQLMKEQLSSRSLVRKSQTSEIIGWDSYPEIVSWYTQKTVDLAASDLQTFAQNAIPLANSPEKHESISIIQLNALSCKGLQQLAQTYNVNIEFPYLDSLIIDTCLSARPEERTTPFSFKPLLSKALQNDLPSSVFTRNTKGSYTADDFVGIQQNFAVVKDLFKTSLLADMGLVDVNELRNAIRQFNTGIVNTGFSAFSQTLATELWLRRLVDAGNNFWVSEQRTPIHNF
ncbi:MAG: albusnodin/ikarugamycin family macrolactam cyclase [Scytonematopsis contorta HA4267-MV1]|jgi:asparagine synthase (glutamine-hydrolysing)|nr:albusnodin/ikarugamycin family macrolactam cyclase [Scytonematopsis contorta HA4267-MV1]